MIPYCDRLSGAQSGVLLPPNCLTQTKTGVNMGVDYTCGIPGGGAKTSHVRAGPPTPRASLTQFCRHVRTFDLTY